MTYTIKKALLRFFFSLGALICVIALCFSKIDPGLVGFLGVFAGLVLLPVTILLSIDASRVISTDLSGSHSGYTAALGKVLGIPQLVLGVLLILIGIAYPILILTGFVGATGGLMLLTPLVVAIISLGMLALGYFYFREGLRLVKGRNASPR